MGYSDTSGFTRPTLVHEFWRVLVIGGTGLVGYHFIQKADGSSKIGSITVLSRKQTDIFKSFEKVVLVIEADSDKWEKLIDQDEPFDLVFSSLGTKIGDNKDSKNNFAKELKTVDLDLNVRLAKAAKRSGSKVFGLVTSFNNPLISTIFPYFKLKKELEQEIISIQFERTIIFRPGPLIGDRKQVGQFNSSITTLLSSIIAQLTYKRTISFLVGTSIKVEEMADVAVHEFEVERSLCKPVKFISSKDILELARCLQAI